MVVLNTRKQQLILVISASIALFVVNNIIFGSVIPRLPGGCATGITTMFAVTLVGLAMKRSWCIPMLYFIYGLIGLISHLLVGDLLYLFVIISIVVVSAVYNWALHRYHYIIASNLILFPLYVIVLQFVNLQISDLANIQDHRMNLDPGAFFLSLLTGYLGIILAYICYTILNKNSMVSRRS